MKLTENQFEKIFILLKDKKETDFKEIEGFDHFDFDDQERIIREWTINNSEDYMIDLANEVITTNDGEPYTPARVASKLNITTSLAERIIEYIIKIEDGEITVPSIKEKCIKRLRHELDPIINNEKLEPERRRLLKEELDGICEKGNPERVVAAMRIAQLFRINKIPYTMYNSFESSLVAYHLHIHDVDCYKIGSDYHISSGLYFGRKLHLIFEVPKEYEKKAHENIKELFLDSEGEVKIYKHKIIFPSMVTPLLISGTNTMSFLRKMDKVYPLKDIDVVNNADNLIKLINNGSIYLFKKDELDFIKETYKHYGKLTYSQFVDIICYFHSTRKVKDTYLKEDGIYCREDAIKLLSKYYPYEKAFAYATCISDLVNEPKNKDVSNLLSIEYLWPKASGVMELNTKIKEVFYLVNYPEESLETILETKFDHNKNTNGIINNSNKYESHILKNLLHDYHSIFTDRYIGIFFFINGKLKTYKEKLMIDDTKDFADVDKGHFDLFNSYNIPKGLEYSMFPRGRILYNVKDNVFYLYADKTILNDKNKIDELYKEFNLPKIGVKLKRDEHYKTLRY